jgi:hypothetical protein
MPKAASLQTEIIFSKILHGYALDSQETIFEAVARRRLNDSAFPASKYVRWMNSNSVRAPPPIPDVDR